MYISTIIYLSIIMDISITMGSQPMRTLIGVNKMLIDINMVLMLQSVHSYKVTIDIQGYPLQP